MVTRSSHLCAMELHAFWNFVTCGDFSERTLAKCVGNQKLISIIWVFNSCLPNWVLENYVFGGAGHVLRYTIFCGFACCRTVRE